MSLQGGTLQDQCAGAFYDYHTAILCGQIITTHMQIHRVAGT